MSGLRARTSSFQDLMTGVTTAPEPRARFESEGVPANEESRRELMWTLMSSYLPRDVNSIEKYIVNHIEYTLARTRYNFDSYAAYQATAYSVRDRLIESFNDTQQWFDQKDPKRIYYLSLEFLMGRTLHNALSNLGLKDKYTEALRNLGFRLEDMYDMEKDAALGNGGLGRLAACFMDSLATHNYPGWGYGIRYKYGMFAQKIVDGFQVETPDIWLTNGNPWEIQRLDVVYPIRFYGSVSNIRGKQVWEGGEIVDAVAYDNPIPGYDTYNTNNIRLWSGKPAKEFDLASFNEGDYIRAIEAKQRSEDISAVLYPNDNTEAGKELRLRQQFFFVSATLQDVIRRFKGETGGKKHNWNEFPEKVAVQLNDTHPTLGISELMRQLMDLEGMGWDEAWKIVYNTFGYTNHTVMPEALEKWSVPLMSHLLPRHVQIIFEINYRFLQAVEKKWPGDWNRLAKMSIIEESSPKMVRMAVLAVVGSHAVNGVAAIHSELVKTNLFPEFVQFYGDKKFSNKTNGVTPRRWLLQCNPGLASIISKWLGSTQWVANLGQLAGLKKFADNADLRKEVSDAKRENKERLANLIYKMNGVKVRPDALFDVQVKRIHEYKRQLLNILQVIHRYNRIKRASPQERSRMQPRVCIFGGKAAPGYWAAKMIIRLITGVGKVVNDDKDVGDLLKVVFLANYNVSLAEVIIPANDISEHISTAGTEASGTSNMKFVLNGGLIVGTMDGANIEIREEVGDRNIFIFGCLTPEVEGLRHKMRFERPKLDQRMDEVLNQISAGKFGPAEKFQFLVDNLRNGGDTYLLAHDFPSYVAAQDEVDKCFQNRTDWVKRTIEAVSGMGKFSSDRTIHEYCAEIWNVPACAYTPPDNMTFRKPHWSDSVEANLSNMA